VKSSASRASRLKKGGRRASSGKGEIFQSGGKEEAQAFSISKEHDKTKY